VGEREALGIYFEVYALTDLDDAYMLEYQIVKRERGTLLRRSRPRTAIYQARQAVVGRRLPAAFLIDQAEWEGAETFEVIVTATNLETGASVERALAFTVIAEGGAGSQGAVSTSGSAQGSR
jgi:hypothetical protein